MMKVSVVTDPSATLAVPNALAITGGNKTVNETVLLVAPAPLWVAETAGRIDFVSRGCSGDVCAEST
jgi:hypothetical protein